MNIQISVTFSPHIVEGIPRGYYLVVPRLFPNGTPILRRDQFVGISKQGLVVTIARENKWATLMHMAIYAGDVAAWLERVKMYVENTGVRIYIPGKILKPTSAEEKKTVLPGVFTKTPFYGGTADMWFIRMSMINADILLGRSELCQTVRG